ncbi:hypothetical protein KC976_04525, partial [Candidatus Saccharibacteria bacterium]|nr:hypothetical protein [Candidatus Saccharibacteria bacterium]
ARVGGAANPLVWHAAYPDSDGVMQAQLIGSGTPSFTNSSMLLPDFEGVDYTIGANSPPWRGARKVENRCLYSEDFSNGSWTTSNCSKTGGQADPFGGSTATRITATSNNGRLRLGVPGSSASNTYVNSIWMRRVAAVTAVQIIAPDSNTSTTITTSLTTEWQRFTVSSVANGNGYAYIGVNISLSGEEVEVAFAQQEDVSGATNQNPGEYMSTTSSAASKYLNYANGNTVASSVVTEVKGADFATQPTLYGDASVAAVFDAANISDTQGAIYLEVTATVAGNILGTFIEVSGAELRVNDGTTTAARPWMANTIHKVGIVWHGSTMAINVDGAWSADAAYDGTLLSGALDLFRSAAGSGTARNVRGYSIATLSSGKATINTLMASNAGIGGIKDIVLLIGQSNMGGRADYDDNGVHAANTMQWNQSGELVAASVPLDHPSQPAGSMGLDISFSTEYASNISGTELVFVPCAEGSTGFSDNNWNSGDAQYEAAVSRVNAALA